MNILTFDIEEWFHHLDNGEKSDEAGWDRYEVRIYENVERIFRILEDTGSTATFFIIGWIARTYPDLVRRIAEKYEIGNHTACHRMIWQQTPEEFREDVHSSTPGSKTSSAARSRSSAPPASPSARARNGPSRSWRRKGSATTARSSRRAMPTAACRRIPSAPLPSCIITASPSRSSR